jgi:predicted O-linked N-acetylglucosamine transferase (SPINDLY family)
MARRPAPVSMTWLDSFNTTGLDEIDCFVTDERHSPFGDDQPFSENLLRMPQLRFAYEPPGTLPDVRRAPSLAGAPGVTFGSFNRMAKLSRPVLEAWGAILSQVPGSRLLVKNASLDNPVEHAAYRERFAAFGIAPERLELRGSSSHAQMLAEYCEVDIVLDTFPYNGGITTFEALLMGRPVVALRGDVLLARQSSALLETISRPGSIGESTAAYVDKARSLGLDPARLATAADGLREALFASPAVDVPRFTRDWEHALADAWAQWCAKGASR